MARKQVESDRYPEAAFFAARTCQLAASTVVATLMSYLFVELKRAGYAIPWVLLLLNGTALVTLVIIAVTGIVFSWEGTISASVNGTINGLLSAVWVTGFGLLVDAMEGTVLVACVPVMWETSNGARICRVYECLFVASLAGVVSTVAATVLDLVVLLRVRPEMRYSRAEMLLEKGDIGYEDGVSFEPYRDSEMPCNVHSELSAVDLRTASYKDQSAELEVWQDTTLVDEMVS